MGQSKKSGEKKYNKIVQKQKGSETNVAGTSVNNIFDQSI